MLHRLCVMFGASLVLLSLCPSSSFSVRPGAGLQRQAAGCQQCRGRDSFRTVRSSLSLRLKVEEDEVEDELGDMSDEDRKAMQDAEADFALIQRVEAEVMLESGVKLEDLINPSKVISLEREIFALELKLGELLPGPGAEEKEKLIEKLSKKKSVLAVEKRAVMRGWLKGLFVGQSVVAGAASLVMVYDGLPWQQEALHLPLPIKVLGFWMWWLFIIPSLRARKPSAKEKDALNWAFVASPLVSIALPTVTKDPAAIWWANCAAVVFCYVYAYLLKSEQSSDPPVGLEEDSEEVLGKKMEQPNFFPKIVIQAFKALDYGSGQERGERK